MPPATPSTRRRPPIRVVFVCTLAVLTVVSTVTGSAADEDLVRPDDPLAAPFRDGEWLGAFAASGPVSAAFGNADIDMTTSMDGQVGFRTADGDVAAGEWAMWGASAGTVQAEGVGTGSIINDYAGRGPVEGDVSTLTLGGALDTTWTISFGGSSSTEQDPVRLGPFDVRVTEVDCRRVRGDWEEAFAAEIAEVGGWQSGLSGTFEAVWQGEGDDPDPSLREDAEALIEAYNDWATGVMAQGFTGPDAWRLTPDERATIDAFIADAVAIERAMHELDTDEACIFGERLGTFSFALTGTVQNLVLLVLQEAGALNGTELVAFADVLLAVGGLGQGAGVSDRVAELEQAFVDRALAVIEPHLVTDATPTAGSDTCDPCLVLTDQSVQIAVLVDRLGITIPLDGRDFTPERAGAILATTDGEDG